MLEKKQKRHPVTKTIICVPYDIKDIYAFFCARYKDMSFKELLDMKLSEFNMKLNSIPENEPLYKIIQSRVISLSSIKDKEERSYWQKLKRANKIPDEWLSTNEITKELKLNINNNGGLL